MGSLMGEERHLANGNTSFLTPSPKCKRRKVSAVRDFPCGLNTPEFDEGAVIKRITRASMSKQCSEVNGGGKKFQDESKTRSLPDRLKNHALDCVRDEVEKIKSKSDDVYSNSIERRENSSDITEAEKGVIVQGLMCASSSPWSQVQGQAKFCTSQGKKHGYDAQDNQKCYLTRSKGKAEKLEEKSTLTAPCPKKMKSDGISSNNIDLRENWRQVEGTAELSPSHVSAKVSKGKKHGYDAQYSQKRYLTRSKGNVENLREKFMLTGEFSRPLALRDDENCSEKHDVELLPGPHHCAVSIPPYVPCSPVVMERDTKFEDESEIRIFSDGLKNPNMDFLKDKDEKVKSESEGALTNSIHLQEKSSDTRVEKGVIVLGLMRASSSPWTQVESPAKLVPSSVNAKLINGKKRGYEAKDNQKRYLTRSEGNAEKMTEKSMLVLPYRKEMGTGKLSRPLALGDDDNFSKDEKCDFKFLQGPRHSDVSILPFVTCSPEVTELEKKFEDESGIRNYQNWLKNLILDLAKDKDGKINSKSDGASNNSIELREKSGDITEVENGVIEQGMSASSSPGKQVRPTKLSPSRVSGRVSNEKKHDYDVKDNQERYLTRSNSNAEKMARKSMLSAPFTKELETGKLSRSLARKVDEDYSENEGRDFEHLPGPRNCDVSVPPFVACSSSGRGARTKVRATLRLFQALVRKILQEVETNVNELGTTGKTAHIRAANVLKEQGKYINTERVVGAVPGVEIGDIFSCRLELAIVGIHTPLQSDIDTVKKGNTYIATSVVASGGYDNGEVYSDVLIYTGQGENPMGVDKKAEDQKLERGNLALKNCIDERSPVRVIRGLKEAKPSDNGDGRAKVIAAYTYDGLYTVKRYWYELGPHGNWVYKFELIRISGQHQLAWNEVKHSNKCKTPEGCRVDDISIGREKLPICAVNTVDDEKPPPFTYITGTMYPDWCRPLPLEGCNCKGRCSNRCACAKKNGGEIPYNLSGAIVEAKPLVYECGPSCKCPPSCPNRVSQHGIKLPLEIFKTKSMGWGVRCRSSIPSGSFICEYIGELLDDKEAEQRIGSDEYLFDIGQNYNDNSFSDGPSDLMPHIPSTDSNAIEDVGFTIDAARYGSIGRFVNHSCSPNLYAQNVLYDHEDERIPHVMLFAAENIPPLQELTYHYNYTIDQVFDSKGNIKKKNCYCGSVECTGRLY